MNENKLLASAEGIKLSKIVFIILLICGTLIIAIGIFLVVLEFAEASQYNDDIIMFHVIEGIIYATLGVFMLVFAAPFRKRGNTYIRIYEDHIMAKWLMAKEETRVDFVQVVTARAKSNGMLEVTIATPYNKPVFCRTDSKNALELRDIILQQKII
ncbi:MAG: hypothetical protein FWE34_06420 [Defluviitaleaceae bacterium]|nr:hypothetical protein [Defluviitaleaceae bacterium]